MPTALVTGAAGFIGSTLVDALLDRGYTVNGLDSFATGRRTNLESALTDDRFTLYEGDIRNPEVVLTATEGVDVVFHQAAVASVAESVENPARTTDVNCTGTATVVDAARSAGVDRLVVASSSAVYGSGGELPKRESMPLRSESPYALSKEYTEQLARQASELYDLDSVALRYFNVFGPRQDPQGEYAAVIPKFAELLLDGSRPVVFGDGEQSRDCVYVDDVVRANLLAAEADGSGDVFNVARGERLTINELVETLNRVLGTELAPRHDDPRPGDIRHSGADISNARERLGFEPAVDFEAGLRRTIGYYDDR